jgi:S-adenosylmethionine:tRNA ribosyltransferase-isomerase
MNLNDFDFDLPSELIATRPNNPREKSKMLVVDNDFRHTTFDFLLDYLDKNDVLVINNTKVLPTYLVGDLNGSQIKVTAHKKLDNGHWLAYLKPARKVKDGDQIILADKNIVTVEEKTNFGEAIVSFSVAEKDLINFFEKNGSMPLPPYILKQRDSDESDINDYQTIYATNEGSIAAPTAGLHFNEKVLENIRNKISAIVNVTLHVGAGTFSPIRDNIENHKMHSEFGHISKEDAEIINNCKLDGGRVIAVGTTTLRLLESAALGKDLIKEYQEETDIFIKPGFKFNIVDVLLTNFHLPKSSLLLLISAFAGSEKVKLAYEEAIKNRYRFFSYGDVSLLYKNE